MFILCKGKIASKPFHIPFGKISIYSLEELCYCIYHNIYSITEDLVTEELIGWLDKETDNHELAQKLRKLTNKEQVELRDIVVTILCSADYYNEEEIRQLVEVMDSIAHLPIHEKKKIKADNYLRQGQYGRAAASYRKLLNGSFAVNFSTEEYGNILHNQGIANFYVSSFQEAARDFKEAYVRNHDPKSREHYLYVLLMTSSHETFENEGIALGVSAEELMHIQSRFHQMEGMTRRKIEPEQFLDSCKEQLRKAFAL